MVLTRGMQLFHHHDCQHNGFSWKISPENHFKNGKLEVVFQTLHFSRNQENHSRAIGSFFDFWTKSNWFCSKEILDVHKRFTEDFQHCERIGGEQERKEEDNNRGSDDCMESDWGRVGCFLERGITINLHDSDWLNQERGREVSFFQIVWEFKSEESEFQRSQHDIVRFELNGNRKTVGQNIKWCQGVVGNSLWWQFLIHFPHLFFLNYIYNPYFR